MAEPGMSIEELRETAVRLNNPKTDVELRQKALTNLFVELCDRNIEMREALGSMNRRLTESIDEAQKDIPQIKEVLTDLAARIGAVPEAPPTPADEAAANDAAARAKAELAQLPVAMQGQVTQLGTDGKAKRPQGKPSVVKTSADDDPATIAAKINNVVGVPPVKTIG